MQKSKKMVFSPPESKVSMKIANLLAGRSADTSPETKKSAQPHTFSQTNFTELYQNVPQIYTSPTYLTVTLQYRSNIILVKVPFSLPLNSLPYILHKEIYKFLLNTKHPNPLLETAKVVGFESVDGNTLIDYKIAIGCGQLEQKLALNCLQYVEQGGLKRYKVCKCLAIGGFSKVYLVRNLRDGKFYAMKVMLKRFIESTQKESIIENERDIFKGLNHPFIVRLNHSFETQNFVCLVMDYCPGGELFYYLKKVKKMCEKEARFYFIEILYGLLYLHQNKIVYRDLKPENLLIDHDGHIKIADFGLSKPNMKERDLTYSFCGSTEYMPPEMILRQGHSFGVDFYTLGALLYELVTGLPPFYSKDEEEIKNSIVNEELSFPDHIELSAEIKNLLIGLLHKNQKMRIGSMKGLKEILFHPWVGKINSEFILSKGMTPPFVPSIDEFNFDENELGEDEAEFTQALLCEHLIPHHKQRLIYKNFEYLNERPLRPELQAILDMYKEQKTDKNNKFQYQNKTSKRLFEFKKSHSIGNLRSKNISDDLKEAKLKRMASSPYLRTAASLGKNKNGQEKPFRNAGSMGLNKRQNTGLLYESPLRSALMNHFEKPSNSNSASKESIYSQSIRKNNQNLRYEKQKSQNKENQHEKSSKNNRQKNIEQLLKSGRKYVLESSGRRSNPFMKKKKFTYASILN